MHVHLQYGTTGLEVDLPSAHVSVFTPRFIPGLPDERAAFEHAVRHPVRSAPLRAVVRAHDRVAIVIPDITRPMPTARLLSWVLDEIGHVPLDQVVIVNGTGSHRANTPDELRAMVGDDVFRRVRIVNHDAHDPATLATVGPGEDGHLVSMCRACVEADRRLVLGLVEPHFMAGFSGGYKGIFPAVADIAAIMRYHDAQMIGHPNSTWGAIEGNPTQRRIRHDGALLAVDFCVNVTVNRGRAITGVFCGAVLPAHDEGCAFSRATSMVGCSQRFPIVITTNSGYPLDQNLYQAVKGMSAAAQIVTDGGLIIAASRCNDGFPSHGNFRSLLLAHPSPRALLDAIAAPGFLVFDQWEAQLLSLIQLRARVLLYSEIPAEDVRAAHLEPVEDIAGAVRQELERVGLDAPIAVLPEGPMTIPYIVRRDGSSGSTLIVRD
jgi:lactate racemase